MTDAAWKPRLIALDVDGTLLDPDTGRISASVKAAVHRVLADGSRVVVSTGRTVLGVSPVLDELELTSGFALCSNGAVLLDVASREAVSVETFHPAPVLAELVDRLPGVVFAAEDLGTGNRVTAEFPPHQLEGAQRPATVDELAAAPVPRLIASWPGRQPDELAVRLAGVELPSCTYTLDHYEPWVTVTPEGVTKGSALEKLRAELGVLSSDTFAAGDGDNDVEMLRWAAHGVAMGQGPAAVHAAADEVALPVAEDGLAKALGRWFR